MAPAILALLQFAPSLFKFFSNGEAPPKIVETIGSIATGVSGASTVEEAVAIFQNNKEKAWEFKLQMLSHEKEMESEFLKDRQDARARDVELAKAGYRNVRGDVLAYGAIGALGGLLFVLIFREIPAGPGRDILAMCAGTLLAVVKDVYSFEFGTSRQSKEKDIAISELAKGK